MQDAAASITKMAADEFTGRCNLATAKSADHFNTVFGLVYPVMSNYDIFVVAY